MMLMTWKRLPGIRRHGWACPEEVKYRYLRDDKSYDHDLVSSAREGIDETQDGVPVVKVYRTRTSMVQFVLDRMQKCDMWHGVHQRERQTY